MDAEGRRLVAARTRTGGFDDDRCFDIPVAYAKASPERISIAKGGH
jgi:hypothetical protein